MIERIKRFLFERHGASSAPDGSHSEDELHVAAAAMLIEAAMMDGEVSERERARIATLIEHQFGLSPEAVETIIVEGDRRITSSADIYSFLRVLIQHFNHAERVRLLEMLWEVAYADGALHDHEANLVRRVAGMLGVPDREAGEARKRVLARIDQDRAVRHSTVRR